MKKALFLVLSVAIFAGMAMAQVTYTRSTGTPIGATTPIDKLGAHNNGGRGCTGCHAPHSGQAGAGGNAGSGTTVDANAGNDALWGQDMGPLYGYTLNMGDSGSYVETLPTTFSVGADEIRGIMMCLSCHDGNIAKGAMMTNQSWEQRNSLLPSTYGAKPIPTLLGNDGTTAGNYNNDHPVGLQATLGKLGVSSRFNVTMNGTKATWSTTDAQYLEFIGNYGMPSIGSVKLPSGFAGGAPTNGYVVCTTCHTPHTMYTKSASATTPIAGLTSGVFPTFFFISAPYNPSSQPTASQASSATQFCRQCHFTGAGGSNEGSNIHGVTTAF